MLLTRTTPPTALLAQRSQSTALLGRTTPPTALLSRRSQPTDLLMRVQYGSSEWILYLFMNLLT